MLTTLNVFIAGTAIAGSTALVGAPTMSVDSLGHLPHHVALTSAADIFFGDDPTGNPVADLGNPMQFVLDDVLGIGQKTLPQLMVNPFTGAPLSFGDVLSWVGLSTDDQLSTAFTHLGLNNLTIDGILNVVGVSDTDTVNAAVQQLSQLLGGFGLIDDSTIAALLGDPGTSDVGDMTLAEVLAQLNLNSREPLDQLLSGFQVGPEPADTLGSLEIGQLLNSLLPPDQIAVPIPPGVEDTTTFADFLTSFGVGDLTIDQLLGLDPVAALL